jgi:hypothetical protein
MRAFLIAVLAAVLIAAGAALVLNYSVQDSSANTFSTRSVRI